MTEKTVSRFSVLLSAIIMIAAFLYQPFADAQISPPPSSAFAYKTTSRSLIFSTMSPIAIATTAAGNVIDRIIVIVDTPFNGAPTLSIGVAGLPAKYVPATSIDLTQPTATLYQFQPGLPAQGIEALIGTYASGGATQGTARILIYYGTPL